MGKRRPFQVDKGYNPTNRESFRYADKFLPKMQFAPLKVKEEKELLIKAAAGDKDARNALICSNLRFCMSFAGRYSDNQYKIEDAFQNAAVGLILAVDKANPEKPNRVLSFAVWEIKNKVMVGLENKNVINPSLNDTKKAKEVEVKEAAGEDITKSDARKPLIVSRLKEISRIDHAIPGTESLSLHDTLESDDYDAPDAFEDAMRESRLVNSLQSILLPNEFEILIHYFGLFGETQKEMPLVARHLGAPYSETLATYRKAIAKLRDKKEFFTYFLTK